MCTAYEIGKKGNRLPSRVKTPAVEKLLSMGEPQIVRPTLSAPVIMPDGDLREMNWGFRRKFRGAKEPVSRTIVNSREDKLTSGMWWEAFRDRRRLIPAIASYEWVEGPGGKAVPLRFTREDAEWVLIAGIWEDGEAGPCFSMLTTEPSAFVGKVHERMPAVLEDAQIDLFLEGQLHEFGPSAVPLIVRWPGKVKASTVSDGIICLTDFVATSVAIVGAELPVDAAEDSVNMLPALLGQSSPDKPLSEAIVHHSSDGVFAIRQGKWKLIPDSQGSGDWRPPRGGAPVPGPPGQRYVLETDPGEQANLWNQHKDIVSQLTTLLERYQKEGRSVPCRK